MKTVTTLLSCLIASIGVVSAQNFTDLPSGTLTVQQSSSSSVITSHMGINAVTSYNDRSDFEAGYSGILINEDFSGGPGVGVILPCGAIVSSAGDGCFSAGVLEEGFNVTSDSGGDVIFIGEGAIGNTSAIVGANTFLDVTILSFAPDGAFAAGFDLFVSGVPNCELRVYDTSGGLLEVYNLNNIPDTENFFGVISDVAIGKIEIEGEADAGELFGNLSFGTDASSPGNECENPALEVNQDTDDTCMSNISQGGLAQSFIPLESESAGVGLKFRDPSSGLDVDLSLWDGLPNAGGNMLASGSNQTDGTEWTNVLWDNVVTVTVGNTYYIVIDGDIALPCLSGSTNNPYLDGMAYANNYQSFPDFDYTFRTYSCDDVIGVTDNLLEGFTYYPNPTNGMLNLSASQNIQTIEVFNMLGQKVVTSNIGATSTEIDLSGLATGTYVMRVAIDGQIGTYKVIKN